MDCQLRSITIFAILYHFSVSELLSVVASTLWMIGFVAYFYFGFGVDSMSVNNQRTTFVLTLALVGFYLLFIVPAPGIALPWMLVDDGLFFRWSISINHGDWLGPWDFLATAKGPFHSVMVALASRVGVNPFAYKRLFLLVSSLILVHTVISRHRPWLRLLLLVALLIDPFQFGALGLRNLREGTYLPIQMIALGLGSLGLERMRSKSLAKRDIILPVFGMGIGMGLLMIIREGRIIVWLELLIWLALAGFILIQRRYRLSRRSLSFLVLNFSLLIFMIFLPLVILASVQKSHYGYLISNSLEEGSFNRFYGKLSNLRERGDDRYIPRVPVKKQALSIAMEELPERPLGLRHILAGIDWGDAEYSCREYPDTCKDMASGWLQWSIRKSIGTMIMPYGSEREFQLVLNSAERELDRLCKISTRLECVSMASGFMIAPKRWGFQDILNTTYIEAFMLLDKVFIPQPFPFGPPDLSRNTTVSPLARQDLDEMGIHLIAKKSQIRWQRFYIGLSLIGYYLRLFLFIAFVLCILSSIYQRSVLRCVDPVAVWLLICALFHSGLYTLISLTAFSGSPYTILAAPIAVVVYARIINNSPSLVFE